MGWLSRSRYPWQWLASLSTSPYPTVHLLRSVDISFFYFYLFVSGAALPLPPGLREQGGSGGGQEGAGTPEEGADQEDPGSRQTLRLTFFGRLFDKLTKIN